MVEANNGRTVASHYVETLSSKDIAMEIKKIPYATPTSIESFADHHGLSIVAEQGPNGRWRARFEGVQFQDGCGGLVLLSGDGHSVESAILDYCRNIGGRLMVIKKDKEVKVPAILFYEGKPQA